MAAKACQFHFLLMSVDVCVTLPSSSLQWPWLRVRVERALGPCPKEESQFTHQLYDSVEKCYK